MGNVYYLHKLDYYAEGLYGVVDFGNYVVEVGGLVGRTLSGTIKEKTDIDVVNKLVLNKTVSLGYKILTLENFKNNYDLKKEIKEPIDIKIFELITSLQNRESSSD